MVVDSPRRQQVLRRIAEVIAAQVNPGAVAAPLGTPPVFIGQVVGLQGDTGRPLQRALDFALRRGKLEIAEAPGGRALTSPARSASATSHRIWSRSRSNGVCSGPTARSSASSSSRTTSPHGSCSAPGRRSPARSPTTRPRGSSRSSAVRRSCRGAEGDSVRRRAYCLAARPSWVRRDALSRRRIDRGCGVDVAENLLASIRPSPA